MRPLELLILWTHLLLTGFNLTGWIWRPTRRLHLAVIVGTIASWFGLGLFFGWGYCPFTDWQWDLKRQLGETNLPASWVKYYLDWGTGLDWAPNLVDGIVIVSGLSALSCSVWVNWRDWKNRVPQSLP